MPKRKHGVHLLHKSASTTVFYSAAPKQQVNWPRNHGSNRQPKTDLLLFFFFFSKQELHTKINKPEHLCTNESPPVSDQSTFEQQR